MIMFSGHVKLLRNDDPEVLEVADFAINLIQRRSNSLFPYVLKEILHVETEVPTN